MSFMLVRHKVKGFPPPVKHAQAVAVAGDSNGTGTVSRRNQFKYVPAGTGPAYWAREIRLRF